MGLQHGFHGRDDGAHLVEIGITDADGFLDAPVGHAGGVFHHYGGEEGVRHINRILVEATHPCLAPADVFHRAFDGFVRRADPFAHRKRAVQINGQAAKEVGQHVLGGKTHGNAANPAKGQHAGNAESQGLQDDQSGDNDDRDPAEFGEGVDGGAVDCILNRLTRGKEGERSLADQPQQEPRERDDDKGVAGGRHKIVSGGAEVRVHDLDGERRARHPQNQRQRFADGFDQRVIPHGRRAEGSLFDLTQQKEGADVKHNEADDHRQHLGNPGFCQEGKIKIGREVGHKPWLRYERF